MYLHKLLTPVCDHDAPLVGATSKGGCSREVPVDRAKPKYTLDFPGMGFKIHHGNGPAKVGERLDL